MNELLPSPHITALNDKEQIQQMRSYLFQLKESLEFILTNIGKENLSAPMLKELQKIGVSIEEVQNDVDMRQKTTVGLINESNLTVSDVIESALFEAEKTELKEYADNAASEAAQNPGEHEHTVGDITDFPSTIPPSAHTHTKSEVTDFAHTHSKSEISDFPSSMTPTAHTHSKSEITDFPDAFPTETNLNLVNKAVTWNTGSYIQHVILLLPVPQSSTTTATNYFDGRFKCWKWGANVYDVVEVNANCVYGTLKYHLEYYGDHASASDVWKLCVCTYNGVQYYALKCPYHANPYTHVDFMGHVKSALTGGTDTLALPFDIPYYNENTATVLNAEVYNSLNDTLTTTYITGVNSNFPLNSPAGFRGNLVVPAGTDYTTAKVRNAVIVTSDPGEGASVSYPNGTLIFVKG